MVELCVVIPTLNEVGNIEPLIERLERVLAGRAWEVVFVDDDSRDGTADLVRRISLEKPYVRVVQRIGRRGLSTACVEGMMASAAPYLAVMDGDLQHDESILPRMLDKLRDERLDVVVGSRNVEGGSMGDFAWHRRLLSDAGRQLSRLVCRCEIQDPMSGFFLVDRRFFEGAVRRMSGAGFKILVDMVSSSPTPPRLGEVPYRFRERRHGESKLESTVLLDYAYLIADKLVGDYIPFRFVLFVMAGLVGLVLHLAVLWGLLQGDLSFLEAQASATFAAMTLNYLLNNAMTFRDRRRRGWGILGGLLSFYAACSIGALTNIALAQFLFDRGIPWYVAGAVGIVVGSVWNFSITSIFTWRQQRRRTAANREAAAAALADTSAQE